MKQEYIRTDYFSPVFDVIEFNYKDIILASDGCPDGCPAGDSACPPVCFGSDTQPTQ